MHSNKHYYISLKLHNAKYTRNTQSPPDSLWNNDIEAILKDYNEQSELLTADGKLTGLKSIRKFFEDFFQVIPTGSTFEIKQLIITGSVAYITWSSESAIAKINFGTDTFFIEGDAIKFHSVADYRTNR